MNNCKWCTSEQLCVLCEDVERLKAVGMIKKSMNYGESKIPYSVFLLGAVLLGVIVAMIQADMPTGIN